MSEHEIHSGYLIKSPPLKTMVDVNFKRWKRRKFILTDRALAYEKGKGQQKEIPLSSITAINHCGDGKYEFMFSVSTTIQGNRIYFFSADSNHSKDIWIQHLTEQTGIKCGLSSQSTSRAPVSGACSTEHFKKRIAVLYGGAPFEMEVQPYAIVLFPKGSKEVYKSFQIKHIQHYSQKERIFKFETTPECQYGGGWTSVTLPLAVNVVPAVNHASRMTQEHLQERTSTGASSSGSEGSDTPHEAAKPTAQPQESIVSRDSLDAKTRYVSLDIPDPAPSTQAADVPDELPSRRSHGSAPNTGASTSTATAPTTGGATATAGRPSSGGSAAGSDENADAKTSLTNTTGDGNSAGTEQEEEASADGGAPVARNPYSTLDWEKMEALRIATELHSPMPRNDKPSSNTATLEKKRQPMQAPDKKKTSSGEQLLMDIDGLLQDLGDSGDAAE